MSLPSILIGLAFAAVLATGFITSMGSTFFGFLLIFYQQKLI
jgi:hypothetical protein